jgi:hypothetical protein
VFLEFAQLDTFVIGCPLNGTGLGTILTSTLPVVTGAGEGAGAGAGVDTVGVGAVGDSLLPLHIDVTSATPHTHTNRPSLTAISLLPLRIERSDRIAMTCEEQGVRHRNATITRSESVRV